MIEDVLLSLLNLILKLKKSVNTMGCPNKLYKYLKKPLTKQIC